MNNVYNTKEIYTITGDMCYDNKIMMVTAPSEGTLDEVMTSKTGLDRSSNLQQRSTPGKLRTRLRIPLWVDIFIIITVGALMLLIEFGFIPNINQGFICQDPNLSHPFMGDTVSMTALLISGYIGPLLVILLVELLREKSFKRVCVGTVWKYYKECLIGATLVLFITEVIKVIIGEPRPHFLDSCEPHPRNCTKGTLVLDYNCTNTRLSSFFIADLTHSFPSGHTSISLFVAVYCSYLIQTRIPRKSVSALTKPFLISLCLTWSLLCSLTRITDRRHHWWDVAGGAFLGFCGALYTLSLLHSKERRRSRLSRASTTMTTLSEIKSKDAASNVI